MTETDLHAWIGRLEPAGFWIRAAARLIDWAVLWLVGIALALLFALFAGILEGMTGRSGTETFAAMMQSTFIGWIGSAVVNVWYHALFEGVAGSTVGKRLLGLHVIGFDGSPVGFGQALKRSAGFLVDGLFFGAIGAGEMSESPERQRIGDRWGNTRVVRRRSLPPELHPPAVQFFAGLAAAVQVAFILAAVTQGLEYLWHVRGA